MEKPKESCAMERRSKEEMNMARSGQMLEVCLPLEFTITEVRSRLRGRSACHLVPWSWCPGRAAAKDHFVVPSPTVARVSVDTHGPVGPQPVVLLVSLGQATTRAILIWVARVTTGATMLTRSNLCVRPISGSMSQQQPRSVFKSVAQVASRANTEASELGWSLRLGWSLKGCSTAEAIQIWLDCCHPGPWCHLGLGGCRGPYLGLWPYSSQGLVWHMGVPVATRAMRMPRVKPATWVQVGVWGSGYIQI